MSEFWDRLTGSERAYIIAEAGVNHLGKLELGERLIREAKMAGADAMINIEMRAPTSLKAAKRKESPKANPMMPLIPSRIICELDTWSSIPASGTRTDR